MSKGSVTPHGALGVGFMDPADTDRPAPPPVEEAIRLDPRLNEAKKDALIRVYRSFLSDE